MFIEEAEWISSMLMDIQRICGSIDLLNVGSSTKRFREVEQPYVAKIFSDDGYPKFDVCHLDIKKGEGVDMVGSILNEEVLHRIIEHNFDVVLCSNMLEHVDDLDGMCNNLNLCVSNEGFIILTVPYDYPYHNDPIDTMFRPSPEELTALFPNMRIITTKIIIIDDNHFKLLMRSKRALAIFLLRIITPVYKFDNWKKIVVGIPKMFSSFKVSCVVLQKIA